jgi:hypothetical protein
MSHDETFLEGLPIFFQYLLFERFSNPLQKLCCGIKKGAYIPKLFQKLPVILVIVPKAESRHAAH